jgi:hypothetical protein
MWSYEMVAMTSNENYNESRMIGRSRWSKVIHYNDKKGLEINKGCCSYQKNKK